MGTPNTTTAQHTAPESVEVLLAENQSLRAEADAWQAGFQELLEILDSLGMGFYLTDSVGSVRLSNPAGIGLFDRVGADQSRQRADAAQANVFTFANPDPSATSAPTAARDAIQRVLSGEPLQSLDITTVAARTGEQVALNLTGAPLRESDGRIKGAAFLARDITEHRRTARQLLARNEALRRQSEILGAVSFSAEKFLRNSLDADTIHAVLQRLGAASDASRVYVFENHTLPDGSLVTSQRWEWCAEDIAPQIDNKDLQALPWLGSGFDRWFHVLSRGGCIHGRVSEFPPQEQDLLEAQGIRSLVAVPIFVGRTWWGMLGFDDCREGGRFSDEQVEILATAANMLGAAIDRRDAEQALTRALAAAEEGTLAKSQFLANMSHEICTPLNGVIGMTEALLDTALSSEQREFAESARNSGEALLAIINDVLDFSKIEAGRLELEAVDFDLRRLAEDVVEMVAPRAHRKGIDIAMVFDAAVPAAVCGDPTRLRQILVNLLNNAVKFTQVGEVVLTIAQAPNSNGRVIFEVRDTGIGIAPAVKDRLFRPFSQVDASTTRQFGGTGLGLAICGELVRLMEGRIGVESAPGRGSVFTLELPLRRCADSTVFRQPRRAPRRILVVDDHTATRLAIRRLGDALGWEVKGAIDGRAAQALLFASARAGEYFDAILVDACLEHDGAQRLADEVAADPSIAGTPLVLLATAVDRAQPRPWHHEKFRRIVTKPVRASVLAESLENIDGKRVVQPSQSATAEEFRGHILLAEDDATNQRVMSLLLDRLGLTFDLVENGEEALRAWESNRYNLIILDCQMPVLDGYSTAREIRRRESGGTSHVPIIACTAHGLSGDREKCLDAGMDDYIRKPIRLAELEEVLRKRLSPRATHATTSPAAVVVDTDLGPVFDPAALTMLRDLAGEEDPTLVPDLIESFRDETPQAIARMTEAAAAGNLRLLRELTHLHESRTGAVGALGLQILCRRTNAAANAGRLNEAAALVGRMDGCFREIRLEMARAFPEYAGHLQTP